MFKRSILENLKIALSLPLISFSGRERVAIHEGMPYEMPVKFPKVSFYVVMTIREISMRLLLGPLFIGKV